MGAVGNTLIRMPILGRVIRRVSLWYRASVEAELRRYGLRYDDLLNEYEPDVKKAIDQLPPLEQELRVKRLKRAADLDLKKTYLPKELQDAEDVWNPYLRKRIEKYKQQRLEQQTYD